jgi:hypothetical protein
MLYLGTPAPSVETHSITFASQDLCLAASDTYKERSGEFFSGSFRAEIDAGRDTPTVGVKTFCVRSR